MERRERQERRQGPAEYVVLVRVRGPELLARLVQEPVQVQEPQEPQDGVLERQEQAQGRG